MFIYLSLPWWIDYRFTIGFKLKQFWVCFILKCVFESKSGQFLNPHIFFGEYFNPHMR